MSLEEALEISPRPFGKLLGRVFGDSRHCGLPIRSSAIPGHNHNNVVRQCSHPDVLSAKNPSQR